MGAMLATAAAATGVAHAQSSLTLFGTMDAGITYVSNEKGHSAVILSNGNNIPNFWGLRGSEDLGGGTKAVFLLMNQYNLGTGTIIGDSSGLFARNAYVGLSNNRWGTLTAGQQYDFMYDSLTAKGMEAGSLYAGFFNYRQGPFAVLGIPGNLTGSADFDRVAGTARVSNSVKYTSANYGGFSFGALYGFGGQPGALSTDNAISFGANYDHGAFGAGVAYVEQKYPSMNNGHDGLYEPAVHEYAQYADGRRDQRGRGWRRLAHRAGVVARRGLPVLEGQRAAEGRQRASDRGHAALFAVETHARVCGNALSEGARRQRACGGQRAVRSGLRIQQRLAVPCDARHVDALLNI